MNTNILAPFVQNENSQTFYVNGRTFEIKESVITETETINNTLRSAISAFESFEFLNSSVKWYNGSSKFVYSLEENNFTVNGTVVESFTNHVLQSGLVRYNDRATAELFESLPTLVENFIVLDFAATFENNNITVDLFKINENVFVSRFNSDTRIAKFFRATNANDALELVAEETKQDATPFLSELLEGEAKELANKNEIIESYEEMVTFLKDKRGLLAEADKSIEEIKAADVLINEEIANWESKIAKLRA